jgi:hypothetical protein
LAEQAKKTKKAKSPLAKPSPKNKTQKVCPHTKVLNPKTGRCVNKDGAVAKRLGLV